ncbi:hypothetical protein N0V88_001730 [Collariella sp. IMI 366227]|nr:hypothetical protein N0V88_001730 [Collariella sp. IMI 366227]
MFQETVHSTKQRLLALLATLIIHPSFTSRAPETNHLHIASYAFSYLRGLLNTVGPVNADLRAAFEFTNSGTRSSARGGGGGAAGTSGHTSNDDDSDSVGGNFARSQLLFRRAPDFWAVLGWAFRCAAEYPQRWQHWRVWLEYLVSVLEADWDERLARDPEGGRVGMGKSSRPYPMLFESLLVGYLEGLKRERRNGLKDVMRALFAFSDSESATSDRALYNEVFEKETAVSKPGDNSKRKRGEVAAVDLENDQFGDYLDNSSSSASPPPTKRATTPTPKRRGCKPKSRPAQSFTLTDPISKTVPFRLRLFRLLSAASFYLPSSLAPSTSSTRASPRTWEGENGVTVRVMCKCFLPFAAHRVTAEDNAKLSLALESLMGFVYATIEVEDVEGLRRAVEKGIKAREEKVEGTGRKRRGAGAGGGGGGAAEKGAREVLARSGRG